MIQIVGKRGTGKTTRLILAAIENDAVLVCLNPERVKEKALIYGITKLKTMSYNEFINLRGKTKNDYIIDDIDILVKYFVECEHGKLLGYSLTEEN